MSEVRGDYPKISTGHPEAGRAFANALDSSLAREAKLLADFDRVTAERDAALRDLEQQKRYVEINANSAHGKHKDAMQYRAERDALQQRLTAADERADVLETENKRLDLMVSQADYNYDADLMQFKARIDELEGLLRRVHKSTALTKAGDLWRRIDAALKPVEPAKDEHVCTGCGAKGWTASCKECVPY